MNTRLGLQEPILHPHPGGSREELLAGIPVEDRRTTLAGIPTAVLEGGNGPPMLLLHGLGEAAAVWVRVIPELVKSHRVITPDLPGHGDSGFGPAPLDADAVLAWLDQLIEQHCGSPPILVGHLVGGAIAANFALRYPDRVRQLVLVDSTGLGPFRPALRLALAIAGFVAWPNERSQTRLFRGCFADLDSVRRETGDRWQPLADYTLQRARGSDLQTAARTLMPAFALRTIPSGELATLKVPTALIWGREDIQVRLGVAEAASERFGWPLQVIDGAGADPALEQPEAFIRVLNAAIEQSPEAVER